MPDKLFEDTLKAIPDAAARADTIDACDSAYLAMKWFQSYKISYTAADIVALAALIVRPKIARIIASAIEESSSAAHRIADASESISELFDDISGANMEGKKYLKTFDVRR